MADPIKSFLVSLGFKIDESALRNFNAAVNNATKIVANLGTTLKSVGTAAADSGKKLLGTFGITAAGLTLAAKRVVQDFEALYFAVQRSGTSADKLLGLRYAASQVGLGFGGLDAQLNALFHTLRFEPGLEQYMNSMGIATRKANGDLRNTRDIYRDIAGWFKRMVDSDNVANRKVGEEIIGMFGLDPNAMLQVTNNLSIFDRAIEEHDKKIKAAGLNADQLSANSLAFMNTLGSVFATLWVTWDRIAQQVLPLLNKKLKELDAWITANQPEFTKKLVEGINQFIALMEKKETWDAIQARLSGLNDAFVSVKNVVIAIVDGIKYLKENLPSEFFDMWKDPGKEPGRGGQPEQNWWQKWVKPHLPSWLGGGTSETPPTGTHTSARENFAHFNYGNIKSASGGWNEYANPQAGVNAIGEWLDRWYKRGRDTLAKIIETYAPASDNPGKDLIGDAERRTGINRNQIIDPGDPATRRKLVEAILRQEGAPREAFAALGNTAAPGALAGAADALKSFGGRLGGMGAAMAAPPPVAPPPGAPSPGAAGTGDTHVGGVNQNVAINVTGHDAPNTARAVRDTMDRANADMIRNLRGAVDPVGPRAGSARPLTPIGNVTIENLQIQPAT